MKRIIVLFLILSFAYAWGMSADNAGGTILDTFKTATDGWYATFQNVAKSLLWKLALIELTLVMGFMALRGEYELGAVLASLIKNIMLFGFFLALMDNAYIGKDGLKSVTNGFEQLADKASGKIVSLSNVTNYVLDIWNATMKEADKLGTLDVSGRLSLIIVGIIAGFAVLILAIELLVATAKFFILLNVSVLFFAFGIFSYTRQWAINTASSFVKVGVELMIIKLVVSLAFVVLPQQAAEVVKNDTNTFAVIIVALMFAALAKMTHGLTESIFSGASAMNSSSTVSGGAKQIVTTTNSVVGAATGAVAGASASIAAAKDAATATGAPAPSTTSSLKNGISGAIKGGFNGGREGYQKGFTNSIMQPPGIKPNGMQQSNSQPQQPKPNNQKTGNDHDGVDGQISD